MAIRPLQILIVEDDDTVTDILMMALDSSHHVTAVRDVSAALTHLVSGTFDVVITDMLLGEHDGTEVIRAARKTQPRARIVVMSGGGKMLRPWYLLKLGIAFGAMVPLRKPFSVGELYAAIGLPGQTLDATTPPS